MSLLKQAKRNYLFVRRVRRETHCSNAHNVSQHSNCITNALSLAHVLNRPLDATDTSIAAYHLQLLDE